MKSKAKSLLIIFILLALAIAIPNYLPKDTSDFYKLSIVGLYVSAALLSVHYVGKGWVKEKREEMAAKKIS